MLSDIMILIILVLVNAFFAASEIALISLNDTKMKIQADEGDKKAKLLVSLLSEPSKFLATIQIGITLAGFFASALAAENFSGELVNLLKSTGLAIPEGILKSGSLLVITIILSYFTLVLGELVPKRLAMKRPEPIANFVAKPIQILMYVTNPFVRFLTFSMNVIVRLLGVNPNEEDKAITEEEIRMMVDVGEEKGTIDESEKRMINNIFEFNNKVVTEIMTHRTDMVAISHEASLEDIIQLINTEKYSRVPVYEAQIDNIIGILHAKDIMSFVTQGGEVAGFDMMQIMRKPYFIPFSKRIDILLREFQQHKTHMAIIIDEYGGTEGLVTLEDLLEEIVGNIFDEDDEVEREIEILSEGKWCVSGSADLGEVNERLGLELPEDDYETLGGFFIGQLGHIPEKAQLQTVSYGGANFVIKSLDDRKIGKIIISKVTLE